MGNGSAAGWLIAALLAGCGAAAADSACHPQLVEVRGPEGEARFAVDVADTSEERAQGLMFREKLGASEGMLFIYPRPQQATFWMKNTLIPLDMIFADATGRVTRVHARAVPGDETMIDGGRGVVAVLEIIGGRAAELGIGPGAELRHPALDQTRAAWPCRK